MKYLEMAEKLFNSFKNLGTSDAMWIAYIDKKDYYWIEEYPQHNPSHVLNGFISAAIGLYDYYMLTGDAECKKYLLGSLTTLKYYIPEYRVAGGISHYCLKHKVQMEFYHFQHIDLLKILYRITDCATFDEYAQLFESDYKRDESEPGR